MLEQSPGVRVRRDVAEEIRKKLHEIEALDTERRPKTVGGYVVFPIREEKSEDVQKLGLTIVYDTFERRQKVRSYKELVDVPENLRKYLPTSYDQVGDIVLIKIPSELARYAKTIGEAIIKAYKSVKAVYWDLGVKGPYRVHELRHLAGEKRTVTIHKEYGLRFKVDVSKVYVSPRLAEEHRKFSEYVSQGEKVFDMFSGYGPFSIFAAKRGAFSYATDINPYAIHYLYENTLLNKVQDRVLGFLSDCKKVAGAVKVDHVVMNLPHGSVNFLKYALRTIEKEGMIHLYVIEHDEKIKQRVESVIKTIEDMGFNTDLVEISCGKPYAPYQSYYGLHLRILRGVLKKP
ncbi:MAG: class I SAM-dependent methyltransferase family protein [Euryarchaeota archaeon]|nr:class I SAM-dependent methyltransferase family protein [Euryarchaeota archaeon]